MKIRMVTACDRALWESCGAEFLNGVTQFVPFDIEMHCYVRGVPVPSTPRVKCIDLLAEVPDLVGWNIKNHCLDYAYGEIAPGHKSPLHDAGKIANKVYALRDALERARSDGIDRLIWCDVDVRWFDRVPLKWIEEACPDNRAAAYLHRHYATPDAGFIVFNVKDQYGAGVIELLHDAWETNGIFKMPQYTDAYLMLMVMRALSQREGAKFRSCAFGAEHTWAVWANSPLGQWGDHLFGEQRKQSGISPLSDFVTPPPVDHPYWSHAPKTLAGCPTDPVIRHAIVSESDLDIGRDNAGAPEPIPV